MEKEFKAKIIAALQKADTTALKQMFATRTLPAMATTVIYNRDQTIFYDQKNPSLRMNKEELEVHLQGFSKQFELTILHLPENGRD